MREKRKQEATKYKYDRLVLLSEVMSGKKIFVLDDGKEFDTINKEFDTINKESEDSKL